MDVLHARVSADYYSDIIAACSACCAVGHDVQAHFAAHEAGWAIGKAHKIEQAGADIDVAKRDSKLSMIVDPLHCKEEISTFLPIEGGTLITDKSSSSFRRLRLALCCTLHAAAAASSGRPANTIVDFQNEIGIAIIE